MQTTGRLPGAESHPRHKLAGSAGGDERHAPAVTGDRMATGNKTGDEYLHPLQRTVDRPRHSPRDRLLPEHVPRLEPGAEFQPHAVVRDRAEPWKAKLGEALKPLAVERETRAPQITEHVAKIRHQEVRQQKPVVDRRAPADEPAPSRHLPRLTPQPGDQGPDHELRQKPHPHVRRHLEATQLHQPAATACGVG